MYFVCRASVSIALFAVLGSWTVHAEGPYQATGFKVGEVTDTTAIVWTRLTRNPERIGMDAPIPGVLYRDPDTGDFFPRTTGRPNAEPVVQWPEGHNIDSIQGATPGAAGKVWIRYRIDGAPPTVQTIATPMFDVDPDLDFTHQFRLTNLQPDTRYKIWVYAHDIGENKSMELEGSFRTAPLEESAAKVMFAVSTGQAYRDLDDPKGDFEIYRSIRKLDPNFFVHTGDIVYYDNLAKSVPLARWHWARTYSLPSNLDFHQNVSSYFIKDDHDTLMNDCWPGRETKFMGSLTFEQGLDIFREQVPMGDSTYRTIRWGRDLQVWMVEGRDFRSPNTMPDGPAKTIWGAEQKAWFKRTVQESDAAFRVLISPMPVVGPDRSGKKDNHSNASFKTEGDELRKFMAAQKNMVVVCGDRHWQYVSVDDETGLKEYSCGPATDNHAGGWKQENVLPEHRYLNVIGGFMTVEVGRIARRPTLTTRHYSVQGNLLNEDRFVANE